MILAIAVNAARYAALVDAGSTDSEGIINIAVLAKPLSKASFTVRYGAGRHTLIACGVEQISCSAGAAGCVGAASPTVNDGIYADIFALSIVAVRTCN
jgi:hypothetical protein